MGPYLTPRLGENGPVQLVGGEVRCPIRPAFELKIDTTTSKEKAA